MLRYIEDRLRKQIDAVDGLNNHLANLARMNALLLTLWYCLKFSGDKMEASLGDFANAYIHGKTVTRSKPRRRTVAEDIHTGIFVMSNRLSQRAASESRDYIYATMPPFPWYKYPTNAENMAFGELFVNLYNQAAENKHTFAPKITASMIQSSARDTSNGWLPSKQQPEPQCLGDFLKLLGQRLATETPNNGSSYHATTCVHVLAVEGDTHLEVLPMIQSAVRFSNDIWRDCHAGGELSKYGSYLGRAWEMDITNASYVGCSPNPEESIAPCPRAMGDDDPTIITEGPSKEFATTPAELENTFGPSPVNHHVDHVPNFEYSRRVLDAVWYALDNKYPSFEEIQHEMKSRWPKELLHTLTLLTAMVNCQIGLSAARWVRKYFVPALIHYDEDNIVLGLLARHARPAEDEFKLMMSVGRHLQGPSLGKDLVLVDLAAPSAPVGIIPDFCYRNEWEEELIRRMMVLYRGLGDFDEPGSFKLAPLSPESCAASIRKAMQEGTLYCKD